MFPEERRRAVLNRLAADGRLQVSDLADEFRVSEVTIRQDLSFLEEKGLIRRTHGGAIPVETGFELPFASVVETNAGEKARIGEAAAALVGEGETVFLDVGTTTTALARALAGHSRLTVVTNALNIAVLFEEAPGVTVIVSGGTLRPSQHSLVNPLGLEILAHVRGDRVFLGANGIHPEAGVTNANFPEAEIKKAMMRAARQKVLVADSTKIGRISAAVVAPLSGCDLLITGREADAGALDGLRAAGLEIMAV